MATHTHLRPLRATIGVVVSTAMDRTAVVAVPRLRLHPKTRKIMRQTLRFFAHDHHEICGVGDKVHIKYCGQVSRKKHWAVVDILERQPQLDGEPFPMARLRVNPVTGAASGAALEAARAALAAAPSASPPSMARDGAGGGPAAAATTAAVAASAVGGGSAAAAPPTPLR